MQEYYLVDTDVTLSEKIDNDTVVINLTNGCYFNFNPTASVIWEMIAGGVGKSDIISKYAAAFEISDEDAYNDFSMVIKTLVENGLVREIENSSASSVINEITIKYTKPEIEKFDDMQEMLLLDPIHEVTEKGWPYKSDEE